MNTEEKTEVLGPNQFHCHCPPEIPHRLVSDLNSPSGDRQATSGLRRVTGSVIVILVCALISGLQSFCAETYEGSGNGVAWSYRRFSASPVHVASSKSLWLFCVCFAV
jgi:hypothetical protein